MAITENALYSGKGICTSESLCCMVWFLFFFFIYMTGIDTTNTDNGSTVTSRGFQGKTGYKVTV